MALHLQLESWKSKTTITQDLSCRGLGGEYNTFSLHSKANGPDLLLNTVIYFNITYVSKYIDKEICDN